MIKTKSTVELMSDSVESNTKRDCHDEEAEMDTIASSWLFFIQKNLDRARENQGYFVQTAFKTRADVLILSERNKILENQGPSVGKKTPYFWPSCMETWKLSGTIMIMGLYG